MKNINHILTIFLTLAALIGCDNHQSPPPKTENKLKYLKRLEVKIERNE